MFVNDMRPSTETHMSLYRHLGRLFYAISAADGVVRAEEKQALTKMITDRWLEVDDYLDEFGTDCAHYIGIVFDWLIETRPSPEQCFELFLAFRRKHPELFSPSTKKLIWKTADAIAASFAGRNKQELVMLTRLSASLKNDDSPVGNINEHRL